MSFNFKLLPRCGAKARSRGGEPCKQACVMNGSGRCYYHGGASRIKHGRYTKKVVEEQRSVKKMIKECSQLLREVSR